MSIKNFWIKASINCCLIIMGIFSASLAIAINKPVLNPITIPSAPVLSSRAYLLIDHHSNKVLAAKNIHEQVEPASLTKMMTMYVVDNELKNNNLQLQDEVLISKNAWLAQGSRMFLEVGKKIPVQELIKGVIIQSGNDASIALAEHIAGSELAFADLMNGYAKILGMNNTNFMNATGLPDENHYTTAYDMALLTQAIIRDFPDSYHIYSQKSFTFNNIEQFNRNRLLWRNNAVDGVKTGHTESAGFCLVASGTHAAMRLTAVVLGAATDELRINEANKLLIWGFRFFETHLLHKANQALQNARVWLGKSNKLALGFAEDLYITIPHGQFKKLEIAMEIPKIIKAPLAQGTQIGSYKVTLQEQVITEQPIIALEEIATGNWWHKIKDSSILTMQTLWEKVVN